jgi:hypothetical protein
MNRNPINYPITLSSFSYESYMQACAHVYLCLLNPFNERVYRVYIYIYICIYKNSFYTNILKPTSHVMHHQFNIQKLYALPTLYLCVLYLSENKQRLVPLTV